MIDMNEWIIFIDQTSSTYTVTFTHLCEGSLGSGLELIIRDIANIFCRRSNSSCVSGGIFHRRGPFRDNETSRNEFVRGKIRLFRSYIFVKNQKVKIYLQKTKYDYAEKSQLNSSKQNFWRRWTSIWIANRFLSLPKAEELLLCAGSKTE